MVFGNKKSKEPIRPTTRPNIPTQGPLETVLQSVPNYTNVALVRKQLSDVLGSFQSLKVRSEYFLNFGTVFLTTVKLCKLRKANCSPPLVGEDNSMVFTSHSVPFPATRDLQSLVAGNDIS